MHCRPGSPVGWYAAGAAVEECSVSCLIPAQKHRAVVGAREASTGAGIPATDPSGDLAVRLGPRGLLACHVAPRPCHLITSFSTPLSCATDTPYSAPLQLWSTKQRHSFHDRNIQIASSPLCASQGARTARCGYGTRAPPRSPWRPCRAHMRRGCGASPHAAMQAAQAAVMSSHPDPPTASSNAGMFGERPTGAAWSAW